MSRRDLHPLAAMALRGLGNVARKAFNRATASIAEDIGEVAQGISARANDVVVNARCACDCVHCRQARRYRHKTHCENCGVTRAT